jgi:hypothetical protein
MALTKGGIFGNVSGRVAGIEFAQDGGRSVVKVGKARKAPATPKQLYAQNLQEQVRIKWRAMTDEQHLAWGRAAKSRPVSDRFGDRVTRNGFQFFASMPHDFRYVPGGNWAAMPPTQNMTPWDSITIFATDVPAMSITFNGFSPPAHANCGIYISRMCPNQQRKPKSWIAVGLVEMLTNEVLLDTQLVTSMIPIRADEMICVKAVVWDPVYWPLWTDETFYTVLAA